MIQRRQEIMLRFVPDHINLLGIHRWRRRRKTVELMFLKRRQRKIMFPYLPAVLRIQRHNVKPASFVSRASHENALSPEHRRGMAVSRQRRFPGEIFFSNFSRDTLRLAYPGSIWATKSSPFLSANCHHRQGKKKSRWSQASHREAAAKARFRWHEQILSN